MLGIYRAPDIDIIDPARFAALPAGRPLAYTTDEYLSPDDYGSIGVPTLRVYPAPSAAVAGDIVYLRVVRKPLLPFVATRLNVYPEIPEDHHLEMLDWAAYLALRIVDQDAGDAKRALEFRTSFEAHVKAARTMVLRKLFAPLPWGFGRNGWSWGS